MWASSTTTRSQSIAHARSASSGFLLRWSRRAIHSPRSLNGFPVREASIPVASVSGAVVRWPRWGRSRPGRLVLTAADLRAFEGLTEPGGFELAHPAQLVLEVRREDKDAARELATQIELTIADHALRIAEGDTP